MEKQTSLFLTIGLRREKLLIGRATCLTWPWSKIKEDCRLRNGSPQESELSSPRCAHKYELRASDG